MTCKINASTTGAGGLLVEGDSSGVIDLQSNGVTKVSFDASGNMSTSGTVPSSALTGNLPALNCSALTSLSAPNLTGALPAIDGSSLTGIYTPITKSQVIYHSTSTVSSGNTQITLFREFKYPSNGKISGTFNKQSASTTMVVYFHYCARATSGNPHTFAMWCDAGNNTSLFRATHQDRKSVV